MKTVIMLLILSTASFAAPKVWLADRADAVRAFQTNAPLALVEHREGAETHGKVALVIDGEMTATKVFAALVLALGAVFPQPPADCSLGVFRGHECSGDVR